MCWESPWGAGPGGGQQPQVQVLTDRDPHVLHLALLLLLLQHHRAATDRAGAGAVAEQGLGREQGNTFTIQTFTVKINKWEVSKKLSFAEGLENY